MRLQIISEDAIKDTIESAKNKEEMASYYEAVCADHNTAVWYLEDIEERYQNKTIEIADLERTIIAQAKTIRELNEFLEALK